MQRNQQNITIINTQARGVCLPSMRGNYCGVGLNSSTVYEELDATRCRYSFEIEVSISLFYHRYVGQPDPIRSKVKGEKY
mmetsp:Transcript_19611/g.33735  ORF Transcript_19611/g.33735 Transcript_19611/m.33735 type:complete len:80 (+) Transcript_19611:2408-2647(+)